MSQHLISSGSYCVTARAYVTGAHAIVKSEMRARYGDDFRFVIPCMMLIGHAIEVYLKAWLAFRGYTDSALRRPPFGHDLRKLYEEARSQGLPEPEMPPQLSFNDLVESYEFDHSAFLFRYPTEGWAFAVPKVSLVFQIFETLDQVVGSEIGMAYPEVLDWSVRPDEDFRLPATRKGDEVWESAKR